MTTAPIFSLKLRPCCCFVLDSSGWSSRQSDLCKLQPLFPFVFYSHGALCHKSRVPTYGRVLVRSENHHFVYARYLFDKMPKRDLVLFSRFLVEIELSVRVGFDGGVLVMFSVLGISPSIVIHNLAVAVALFVFDHGRYPWLVASKSAGEWCLGGDQASV